VLVAVLAQLAIVTHAPDTVRACDAVEVSVAVSGLASNPPRLSTPTFRPFDVLRASAPRTVYNRARGTVLVEYQFIITTDRTGRFAMPAFEAKSRDERVESPARPVQVLPMQLRGPSVVARARIDTGADLSLAAQVAETVYVGQQATYEVAVFLNQVTRDRLRRNPTFYPPEMQAMLAYDLPLSTQGFRQRSGSQCYDALVYRRAVFPLVPGKVVIPPAQLVYSTALSTTSLFSREESHELQTDSVSIVAVDPPREGRPAEFSGAVGNIRLDSRVDSAASRVGDPLLFTVRVSGTGNVKLFPRPTVRIPWAGLVAADERVTVDSTSARVGGVKEFDWVLTPRIAGEFDVPPVRYGYFDPGRRRYDVAIASGDRLSVANGALVTADTGQAEGPLSIRTRYVGAVPASPQSSPVFWLALALVPIPAIVSRARRRALMPAAVAARDPMQALNDAAASEDPVALRRFYVRALAQRLGCTPSDFTNAGALERALRRAGVSESTAARAEAQLRELDAAAYAHDGTLPAHAARNSAQLAKAVDAEALSRSELPFWIPLVAFAAVLGTASVAHSRVTSHQSPVTSPSSAFASGVSSYLRQDYPAARAAFAEAATLDPRSAEAWANFGTAAWATDDTASAVLGWRQALSLDPSADDMQSRLGALRPLNATSPGWVPSMPANLLVWLAAALWVAAWTLAWIGRRSPTTLTHQTAPIAIVAILFGLAAIKVSDKTAGADTAIVRRQMALSTDPAMGMDRGPGVAVGELVHISARRGAWVHVDAADGRQGWLADANVVFLSDRRIPRE
jgi:tetratricopeptide (TPR) repeat protein